MMETILSIDTESCIRCGKCTRVCPSMILVRGEKDGNVEVREAENCMDCGHCVAVCPTGAVRHSKFPKEKVHAFDYSGYPTAEQLMLLCRARRSNRSFSSKPVPEEMLEEILEAAHRAPTASNAQQVGFTLVTDAEKLKLISDFTLGVFTSAARKMRNPFLKPLLKLAMPGAFRYLPVFDRLEREYEQGNDLILRKAKAMILIHTPQTNRCGSMDANLAYQNGSLMAECLGVSQFYTGFVCLAIQQEGKGSLAKSLGIDGVIYAGMALGMPDFRFPNYIDRKAIDVRRL